MPQILLICVIAVFPLSGFAAMCATVDAQNAVIVNTTPIGECTGLVVMSVNDWPGASIWNLPTNDEIALLWFAGFSIPITLYFIAWSISQIIKFFR